MRGYATTKPGLKRHLKPGFAKTGVTRVRATGAHAGVGETEALCNRSTMQRKLKPGFKKYNKKKKKNLKEKTKKTKKTKKKTNKKKTKKKPPEEFFFFKQKPPSVRDT